MLTDARGVDALGPGELADARDHVLRRHETVGGLRVPERELVAQAVEVRPPLGGVGLGALRRAAVGGLEVDEHLLQVADDRDVGGADLGDLRRVDVDVHDLRVRGEQRRLAGHAVVEARAEGHEQIGLLQREHRRHRAVHAGHTEVLRVRVGERAAGHQRRDDGSAGRLGEGEQLVRGARAHDAAADVEHRLLRGLQQLRRRLDLLAMRLRDRAVAGQVIARRPDEGHLGLLRVLRDVHEHGAGAAGRGDLVGRGDRAGDLRGILHEEGVLRDRHGDADDVGLLEGVRAHQRREDLAGDGEEGHGVHVGVGDRRHEVRGARSGGRDRDADLAGCRGVTLGGVTGALLVADEDVAERRRVHERVVDREDRAAGQAEHVGHPQQFERTDDGRGSGEHRSGGSAGGRPGNGRSSVDRHEGDLG